LICRRASIGNKLNKGQENMGYIGCRMSVNAGKAYKKGLLPRSKFTKHLLSENGWTYSASFFNWLCKQEYIMPYEYHHTTPMIKITPFYALETIGYVTEKYDLESLYKVYLHRCTTRDILRRKGVKRVKILVSRTLMHTESDAYLDCIKYNKLYWWSKDKCFKIDSKEVVLIRELDMGDFTNWYNPNREMVERQIYTRKNYYRRPVRG
jgi:hypothetical protein